MKRIEPKPGQESVWDYPRPPRLEPVSKHLRIEHGGETIAQTNQAFRVLETSHPPVYYFPPDDVRLDLLAVVPAASSFCEWKGRAKYYDLLLAGRRVSRAAWFYPEPTSRFLSIASFVSFYPSKMDACFVGDERVVSQPGDFYGGWITSDIVGPFKGGEGTWGW